MWCGAGGGRERSFLMCSLGSGTFEVTERSMASFRDAVVKVGADAVDSA